ncbi:TPA: restriction endonuclease subunit S [Providencia alcalifaciens]|uniref:restriction endonuclease subunit S n=1 Tax=Providencia alcalifaciens TaxID=126385 RepID=UPI0012B592C9|nr:restriction endonuclease subunit S [Providencia alcalifaciens]MTC32718.1 restriction endonuclease subunit S [Providencia alcalifaciens]
MAGRYKTYSEYQPSNDVHIKQLPIGWIMKPLGLVAAKGRTSFVDGPFGSDLKSDEYQDEGIPLIQLNNIVIGKHILQNMKYITEEKMHQLSRHIAKPNDIVIAKMAEPVARATVVNGQYDKYVIVADCVKLTIDTSIADLSYVVYAINSKEVNSSAELVSTGTTRIRINLTGLKSLKIPFPPLAIQQKIAYFLEYETAKIDILINKQEKLIELLKEKRQAVISHAVTKGLNSDVPMKDSGVEWLGKVPEHWKNPKLIQITARIGDGLHSTPKYADGTGYYFVNGNNIKDGSILISNTTKEVPESEYRQHAVPLGANSVFLSINGTIGSVALYNDEPIILGKSAAYINCDEKLTPHFLMYFLQSNNAKRYYSTEVTGTTIFNLSLNSIRQMNIPLPSLEEQISITLYCQRELEKYNFLINKAETLINYIQERKTALISAAVTGKIDVRDWKPVKNNLVEVA